MIISVCVGSACHLKESYGVITLLQKEIADRNLQDSVCIKGAFCLGRCSNGVTIKIDDEIVCGITTQNIIDVFNEYYMKGK